MIHLFLYLFFVICCFGNGQDFYIPYQEKIDEYGIKQPQQKCVEESDVDQNNGEEIQIKEKNHFYYDEQDVSRPHFYKPFWVFRKYMEINNSLAFVLNGLYHMNGFLPLLINDLAYVGLKTVYNKMSYLLGFMALYFVSKYLGFYAIGLFLLSIIISADYILELVNFLILPYRREYIFFSYKNVKLLYKINYNIGTTIFKQQKEKNFWISCQEQQDCDICYNRQHKFYRHSWLDRETNASGDHYVCKQCLNEIIKTSGNAKCPYCRIVLPCNNDKFSLKMIKLELLPEIFVEFSPNINSKVGFIGRILLLSGGGIFFMDTPILNTKNEPDFFIIPTIKFGGIEAGISLYKFCEIFFFLHPQYLFGTQRIESINEKHLIFNVGISIRFLE